MNPLVAAVNLNKEKKPAATNETPQMPNRKQSVKVSDTTDADRSNEADNIKENLKLFC